MGVNNMAKIDTKAYTVITNTQTHLFSLISSSPSKQ
jgi:hypothetical protein